MLILFDFDRTLFDTDALKAKQSEMIATITGLSVEQVESSMLDYIKTLESHLDFTPEGYSLYLEKIWGVNPGYVLKIYFTDTNYIGNYLFPEVFDVLKELSTRYTLGILTQSHPDHQRVKIERTGVYGFRFLYNSKKEKRSRTTQDTFTKNNFY
jgi:FMN phosphatase YigB (HAD superfamily)